MKNILSKIEFHNTYIIMALGIVLTGHFSNLIVFTSLILIHEIGHAIVASTFKYNIDKIIIYPYGGLTKLNKLINTSITKDLLVAIAGIVIQIIYFQIILILYKNGIIREYIYEEFYLYNKSMIIFNILPIIPLDGSKILNLLLSKHINYNLSNKLTVVISLITILLFIISKEYENNYSIILTIGILMQNIYLFYKDIDYIYNKFLLERYLYNFNYKKTKLIKNKNKMHKNKKHFFQENNKVLNEKEYLRTFFEKNR